MHINDLIIFRDNVAIPHMLRLFEKTDIPDGACYINNIEISFLDGRSYGIDSHFQASGLLYRNNKVEEYHFEESDISLADFFAAHKDCVFISDGRLQIEDQLEEITLNTVIRNMRNCARFFPQFGQQPDIDIEFSSIIFEKMKYLFRNGEKSPLDQQIKSASARTPDPHSASKENAPDIDLPF